MRDRAENQITLVLIRHGATKANMEHRYLGKTDEVLSQEGEMQLFEYKKMGFFPNIDFLFSSP
ncbi:MAG: histidine phosphatase family protein, partial [Lachnospiraceae bacterium]